MMKVTKQQTATQTVSLEACGGGAVMLSLDDGEGHAFRQALDTHDVGAVLGVCNAYSEEANVCEGDLKVFRMDDELRFQWPCDGTFGLVPLTIGDMFVFEEALKSYCRLLMRSPEDLP